MIQDSCQRLFLYPMQLVFECHSCEILMFLFHVFRSTQQRDAVRGHAPARALPRGPVPSEAPTPVRRRRSGLAPSPVPARRRRLQLCQVWQDVPHAARPGGSLSALAQRQATLRLRGLQQDVRRRGLPKSTQVANILPRELSWWDLELREKLLSGHYHNVLSVMTKP